LAANRGLDRLRAAAEPPEGEIEGVEADAELCNLAAEVNERFHAAMDDDFNTPMAVAALFDLGTAINRARGEGMSAGAIEPARRKLVELAEVLGLDLSPAEMPVAGDAEPFIDLLVEVRSKLREAKQWQLSD